MQRYNYIPLPCQHCGKPELRVIWRKGSAVTCFGCNVMRRNERMKKARAARQTATRQALALIEDLRCNSPLEDGAL